MMDRSSCTARRHGTESARHHYGCRCPDAELVESRAVKRRRLGLAPSAFVDPTGTIRRLRALTYLGHGSAEVAAALGWSRDLYTNTRSGARPGRIRRDKAERVRAVYDRYRRLPGGSDYERGLAARKGWVPPWAWDGDVFAIDDPAADDEVAARTAGMHLTLRRTIRDDTVEAARRAAELAAARRAALERNRAERWDTSDAWTTETEDVAS